MKNKTIIFYDFEATSVSRDADPVSVGLVTVTKKEVKLPTKGKYQYNTEIHTEVKTFYAEFDDFDSDKADDWVKENIIGKLYLEQSKLNVDTCIVKGKTDEIKNHLTAWLSQFEEIEFWADFDTIDQPMLIDLIADWDFNKPYKNLPDNRVFKESLENIRHKIGLPKHLPNVKYYDFYDLHTLFKIKGIDPDISREEFAGEFEFKGEKHNALYDSFVNWECYEKLMSL